MAGRVEDRAPEACAECHQEIARQWAGSSHAKAWVDPEFVRATYQRQVAQCLPCHASEPLLEQQVAQPPQLRREHRERGIDCAVCHLVAGAYAGPYKSWGPHPARQDRTRLPCSTFCGACHEVEYQEYVTHYVPSRQPGEAAKQCIECHMPARFSRLTQGHVLSLAHPRRTVHDHSFPLWTEEVTRDAVRIGNLDFAWLASDELEVSFTLTNRNAGHRIPTGHQYGYRELRILVELLGQDGAVVGEEEHSLFAAGGDGLIPDQASPFTLIVEIPNESTPVQARLLVERLDQNRSFRYALATGQWPLPDAKRREP